MRTQRREYPTVELTKLCTPKDHMRPEYSSSVFSQPIGTYDIGGRIIERFRCKVCLGVFNVEVEG